MEAGENMRRRNFSVSVILIGLLFAPFFGIEALQSKRLTVGATVPDHTLKTLAGKTIKLSQYKGKNVVLAFVVHGSGACHAFAPKLEKKIWQVYKDRKTVVIGVLVRARKAKQFKIAHGITFPMAIDQQLANNFSSDGYPFVVVLDGQSKFRFSTKGVAADLMIREIVKALKKQGA
jgi:peroxiredoxin